MEQSRKSVTTRAKMKRAMIAFLVLLLVVMASIIAVGVYWYNQTNRNTITQRSTPATDGNMVKTVEENSITGVVEKVAPSVVSIVTSVTQRTVFGVAEAEAAGTGIIISTNGFVMTNKHVVDGASTIQVVATDGTMYDKVTVVGMDPLNDVAYLKIEGVDNLTPAEIGDSSTVRVGQSVIAIGNALGQYQNTVSNGIISGKGRPVAASAGSGASAESLTDLLQTDAAINPGNSGGPLLNYAGQVIGMNTAVASNAEGIGFAIPINATKGTTKTVLAGKGVQRAFMGVRYVQITPAVARQEKLGVNQGAYIAAGPSGSAVSAGSPADKAGLREGDIITKINGQQIGAQAGVSSIIGEYAPGDTIEIIYLRDGSERTTKLTLAHYQN